MYTAFIHPTPLWTVGWIVDLDFYWQLNFDKEVTRRALATDIRKKKRISLDAIKIVAVAVNMVAALCTWDHNSLDLSKYPVLFNVCNNLLVGDWLNFKCKTSLLGRAVGRYLIGLLMGTQLGIQAQWDPASDQPELGAVKARCLHSLSTSSDLLTACPSLKSCRVFKPSSTLVGTISDILLMSDWKDPLTVRKLEPRTHGSIISSTS